MDSNSLLLAEYPIGIEQPMETDPIQIIGTPIEPLFFVKNVK
jgi:hypothetical protein